MGFVSPSNAAAADYPPAQATVPWTYSPGIPVSVSSPPVAPTTVARPAAWPGTPSASGQWDPAMAAAQTPAPATGYPATGYPQASPPPMVPPQTAYPQTSYLQPSNTSSPPYTPVAATPAPAYAGMTNPMGLAQGGGLRQQPVAAAPLEPCEGADILARVGSEVILASEVLPAVNEILARYEDSIPAHQLDQQRELLIQQQLQVPIETKLIYLDARRNIPAEGFPQIEKSIGEQFDKTELKRMMKSADVETRGQLDAKLRSFGTSIEQRKQTFIERAIAQSWAREQFKMDEAITYNDMLDYYQSHLADYDRPARARWEELMVRFSSQPSKEAARDLIARMGNQVLAGVPLAEIARSYSDGSTATDGGSRDWTTKGSLVSETLDLAIFGLPVGQLSPILESENGYHIVRVVEREQAGRVPFAEAQTEIRPILIEERARDQLGDYVARLREETPVWTIFDAQEVSKRSTPPLR